MTTPQEYARRDRVLIVEGYSDLAFYAEMLEYLGKHGLVYIKTFNGKEDLLTQLEVFITPQLMTEKLMIGVVVDADDDPGGTFTRLQTKLAELTGQTVPTSGTWSSGDLRVGLLVVPDGTSNGEIETLVWRAWANDPVNAHAKACIDDFLACMNTLGRAAGSQDKGRIGALLAVANDEDPRLGPGARAHVFDFGRADFNTLRTFLSLF